MITDLDLVKEQIRLVDGEKLGYDQNDTKIRGEALECRINAEDYEKDFMPSPGKVTDFILPGGPGVRVDTHIYPGYTITPYYDSLIAKLLVVDSSRQNMISRMSRALSEFVIEGVKTTIPFHKYVINTDEFMSGDFDTHFIEKIYSKELIET